jgi:ribulose 1,5-bisphosphate synthetase/thiazole synthase
MKRQNRREFLTRSGLGTLSMMAGISSVSGATQLASRETEEPDMYQFSRKIPVDDAYDLVVVGGGPGGCAAAITAGRLGAKVLLVESGCMLGGMGTAGYVSNWYSLTNGERLICRGIVEEILDEMNRRGALSPTTNPNGWRRGATGFKPESLKIVLDDFCANAGVEVRFATSFVDASMDGKDSLNGVILNNVEGLRYVKAKTFVDGTGDAKVVAACGLPYRQAGRDTPEIMPPTLCATVYNIDYTKYDGSLQQEMVHKGIADDYFSQPDRHVPGLFRSAETSAIMNAGHLFHTDATNVKSYSKALADGRKLVQEYAEFYRKYMPGCENMLVMDSGSLLGIRESRRIVGEYELNYEDYKARRWFHDQIGIYHKVVDIHVYGLSDEEWERYSQEFNTLDRLAKGESYGIPYGILVPKGMRNLWVAGRCNSSDIKVHGAIRDQPACLMMGQAAGTAAVQSINTGQPANDLDTEMLVKTLREAGAYLPQETSSKKMTRT